MRIKYPNVSKIFIIKLETKDLAQMMGAYEKQYINKSLKALNNPKYSEEYLSYYLNRDLMRKS